MDKINDTRAVLEAFLTDLAAEDFARAHDVS